MRRLSTIIPELEVNTRKKRRHTQEKQEIKPENSKQEEQKEPKKINTKPVDDKNKTTLTETKKSNTRLKPKKELKNQPQILRFLIKEDKKNQEINTNIDNKT